MGNISEERRYSLVASSIDTFISGLVNPGGLTLRFSNPADAEILDLLIAAQSKALDLAISFEDRVKENL